MLRNLSFPDMTASQLFLNEVLSLNAQELRMCVIVSYTLLLLNEVLSLNAQES